MSVFITCIYWKYKQRVVLSEYHMKHNSFINFDFDYYSLKLAIFYENGVAQDYRLLWL